MAAIQNGLGVEFRGSSGGACRLAEGAEVVTHAAIAIIVCDKDRSKGGQF